MSKRSLRDLIRQVIFGGLAVGSATQPLPAMSAADLNSAPFEPLSDAAHGPTGRADVVIRKARPKVLLRALGAPRVALLSSHRAHRSHSSHYSSRGGGGGSSSGPTPPPRRDTTPSKPRTPASPRPLGEFGSVGAGDSAALGSRILRRGMTGKDVDQLILLLVKGKLLATMDIPQSSLFTEEVERAVKKFQADEKIPADGAVDYRTLLLLRLK